LTSNKELRDLLGKNGKQKTILQYNSENNLLEFERMCISL